MAEDLRLSASLDKDERYAALISQIDSLIRGESDPIANLANIAAALYQTMNYLWVGFYFVKNTDLVLGPFQGPVACTRIGFGKGVCGACWEKKEIIVVPNVDEFPGHIACSAESKSEIALPVLKSSEVALVLDVDSRKLDDFGESDRNGLSGIAKLVERFI